MAFAPYPAHLTWMVSGSHVPKGEAPPKSVYITLNDRRCKVVLKSNLVTNKLVCQCPGLWPEPFLIERSQR